MIASEPQASMSPATVSTQTMTRSSSKSTSVSKRKCVEQEDVKKNMLEMAEEEHQLKMEILHLKKQYSEAKICKLEEFSFNKDRNNNTNHNQNNDNTLLIIIYGSRSIFENQLLFISRRLQK